MSEARTSDPPQTTARKAKERSAKAKLAIETRWTNERRRRLLDAQIEFHKARLETLRARYGDLRDV